MKLPQLSPFRLMMVGLALVLISWCLATPMFGVPDENTHFIAAVGARHLDFDTNIQVDGFFTSGYDCFVFQPEIPADCYEPDWDPSIQEMETRTAGYSPLFYLVASPPLLIFSNTESFLAVRIWVTFLNFLLISTALKIVINSVRNPAALIPLSLVLLPFPMYFAGSISPSGTAYALALLCSALLYKILLENYTKKTLVGFVLSLLGFILIRRDSVIWVAVMLSSVTFFEPFRSAIRKSLNRNFGKKKVQLITIIALAVVFRYAGNYSLSFIRQIRSLSLPDLTYGISQVYTNFIQFEGVYGWLTEAIPNEIYVLISVVIFGIWAYSFTFGRSIFTLVLLSLPLVAILVLVLGNAVRPNYLQGRYLFPTFAFLLVSQSHSLNSYRISNVNWVVQRKVKGLLFFITSSISLVSFSESAKRFSAGSSSGYSEILHGQVGPLNLPIFWLAAVYLLGLGLIFVPVTEAWSRRMLRNRGSTFFC